MSYHKNLKKFKTFIFSTFLVIFFLQTAVLSVSAQTASPSAEPDLTETVTPTPVDSALQQLKDKVASKLSEKLKNAKAISGIVTKADSKGLTVKVDDREIYDVKFDESLTKYYQVAGTVIKEIKKEDFKKGSYVIVSGPQFDKTINANVVYLDEKFIVTSGKISEVNKNDFSLTVITEDNETYTLDVETKTQQNILNIKTLEIERTGFTKLKEGDTIHFIVKRTNLEAPETRFDAEKILIIPQEFFLQ